MTRKREKALGRENQQMSFMIVRMLSLDDGGPGAGGGVGRVLENVLSREKG